MLLIVNRFRYTNNIVTKGICFIPRDTIVMLGAIRLSQRPAINHHGPSMHSAHYPASITFVKKNSIATTTKLRSLKLLIAITPLPHIFHFINWSTYVLDSNRMMGVWLLPWRWRIFSVLLIAGWGISAETCRLDDVFPPDDLFFRPETV